MASALPDLRRQTIPVLLQSNTSVSLESTLLRRSLL